GIGGQVVVAMTVTAFEAPAHAGPFHCGAAELLEPVQGLPQSAALYAKSGAHRVVHAEPEKLARRGDIAGGSRDGIAKEKPEPRSSWTELRYRRGGHVELQATREQEDAVDGRLDGKVEQVGASELTFNRARPVGEHVRACDARHETEAQIE